MVPEETEQTDCSQFPQAAETVLSANLPTKPPTLPLRCREGVGTMFLPAPPLRSRTKPCRVGAPPLTFLQESRMRETCFASPREGIVIRTTLDFHDACLKLGNPGGGCRSVRHQFSQMSSIVMHKCSRNR